MAGAFGYLVISGATLPTQRAFLMVSIVMAAVMLDRTAISLRLVTLAAKIILLLSPEELLSASFQMSFAAVIALVAAYEYAAPGTAARRERGGILSSRLAMFVAATVLTTVVASLATAPLAVYHFNRVALFGLLANMLTVPMMAMWIMPAGLLSMILMPLGLESWGLDLMGWDSKRCSSLRRSWPISPTPWHWCRRCRCLHFLPSYLPAFGCASGKGLCGCWVFRFWPWRWRLRRWSDPPISWSTGRPVSLH